MKIKPAHLFLILTFVSILFGLLTKSKSIDINLHDTYLIVEYLQIAIIIALFSGIISLTYFGMTYLSRPVNEKTGILHFCLTLTGIVLLLTFQPITKYLTDIFYPNDNIYKFHFWVNLIVLVGPILLTLSLIIFIIGVFNAIRKKKNYL